MAVIYYSGNQRTRAQQYAVTVSSISVGQTITATINSKLETYTSTTTDEATAAAECVSQLSASLLLELRNFTFSSSGTIITAVGPADGAPVTITWGGTATLSTSTIAALSPADVGDDANYVGGAKPGNGDTLVLENGAFDLKYNLDEFTSNTVTLIRRASHTGQVGLLDTNPLGYPEYLPRDFETAGTSLTIEDGGRGFVYVKSTAGSAVTASVVGNGAGQLGAENVRLYGTPASSVVNLNGGGLAFCPLGSQTATAATVRCANAALRIGGGATLTTVTCQNSQVSIASSLTTYTQDRGTQTVFQRAAGGTTLNVEDGTCSLASTGGWTTVNVKSGGTLDVTFAPTTVAITTVNVDEGGTLLDPNERIVQPYALNLDGELANITLDLGTTIALTVG